MTEKVIEFKKRYSEITGRLELLKLEDDIKDFMISEAIKMLPDEEKDILDDILIVD